MSRRGVVSVDFPSLIDILTKSTLERKGPISALSLQSFMKGSQGRNLEAETEVEAVEKCCLLACFARVTQPPFLYNQHILTRDGMAYSGCGGLKKNGPQQLMYLNT